MCMHILLACRSVSCCPVFITVVTKDTREAVRSSRTRVTNVPTIKLLGTEPNAP